MSDHENKSSLQLASEYVLYLHLDIFYVVFIFLNVLPSVENKSSCEMLHKLNGIRKTDFLGQIFKWHLNTGLFCSVFK